MIPTYQDADIVLKLYDQFESERLREAKKWFSVTFRDEVWTYESFIQSNPRGSEGFTQFVTLYGFFEMVGVLHKNGLVHPDLLFDMWFINGYFIPLYPIIAGWRAEGDIHVAENFERLAQAELTWIGKHKGAAFVPQVPYKTGA
ncbi:transposase [Brevibacillus ruminantium]|uniref:Transposase n=1 Tax=Brevibacillus ruminantium TaxID=2950604 RepID=A0ABY4WHG7_9BACL|nr:transposase [Brevibacillus ruminantium]USG65290.1 transposase [Brevibacillus ruminantium]